MKISKRKGILLLILLLALCTIGITAAKYVTSRREEAQMTSSDFHISSDYLKEEDQNAAYNISDWGDGFDIDLYNYEISNIALIAGDDITYSVTVTDGWIQSVNGITSKSYTLKKSSERTSQTIHITPPAGTPASGSRITVTVKTTVPYSRTLTADFTIDSKALPEYSWVYDESTGITTLTIRTNDYSGTYTVKWDPDLYTPDSTDSLMSSWTQASGAGTLTVAKDSAYTLLFMVNGTPKASGSGSSTTAELK